MDNSVRRVRLWDLDETYQGDDVCRLRHQLVRQLLVVVDQVVDVDITVVLLQKSILLQLNSTDVVRAIRA